jgi:hypothetical protein
MRDLLHSALQKFNINLAPFIYNSVSGAFAIPYKSNILRVIASNAEGWDHVSVSLINRCPNHEEMQFIYFMFFNPDEIAVQFSVPKEKHINCHPYCLHLWRQWGKPYDLPPPEFVGPT